jgi:survival-of-motor-neuron-related-splicing factor 30
MSSDQLQEYQSQLADIEELLEDDPTDESLLKLKADLVELISLTQEETGEPEERPKMMAVVEVFPTDTVDRLPVSDAEGTTRSQTDTTTTTTTTATKPALSDTDAVGAVHGEPARKKLKKVKEFEIPAHLQILDTDTEKEKNKKKRTLKSLRSKHREKQREYESTKKQRSWQSFNKKASKKSGTSSIFATREGVHSKVGVVSAIGGITESQVSK